MMAAFNRKSNEDMALFMESLGIKLSDIVPGVDIKRVKDSFLSKNTHIQSITIPFKECKYILEVINKVPVGKCVKESGGVIIKTDTLTMDDWVTNLMIELEKTTNTNVNAADALHKFLME
jgi:hypothetical protein